MSLKTWLFKKEYQAIQNKFNELKSLVEQAEQAKRNAENRVKYVLVKREDPDTYKRRIAEITEDPCFQEYMYKQRESYIDTLLKCPAEMKTHFIGSIDAVEQLVLDMNRIKQALETESENAQV